MVRTLIRAVSYLPMVPLDETTRGEEGIASLAVEAISDLDPLTLIIKLLFLDVFAVEEEGIRSNSARPPLNRFFLDRKDLLSAINVDSQVTRAMFALNLLLYLLSTLCRRRTLHQKMRMLLQMRRVRPQKR